jgi:superfamily II DNA or RNA helicase
MKRFKEKSVEGMTEQDYRIASTVESYSNYYGNDNYEFKTEKALAELCGHPYLFLFKNPSVPVELVKDEPMLYTEQTLNGIKLKTNIAYTGKSQTIIRETQTRCRIISLTPQQLKVVQMIHHGIVVPKKGKDKLLKTISQLSSIMSVHSDLAQEAGEIKTVEADCRIRLQILPMGDGLKAEMFVKPFNIEPPYFKPGKGGKVAYGTMGKDKHQALRDLDAEMANAALINNSVNEQLDADLIHEAVHFHDPYECLELLEIANVHKEIAVIEWPEGERFKLRKYAGYGNLHLNVKSKNNWFEMDGKLQVDEETVLSVQKLLQMGKKANGRFIELGDGEFLSLTEELKKQLDELAAFVHEDKTKLKINFFATQAIDAIAKQAGSFKADKAWKDLQKKIAESEKLEILLPTTLEAELRPYQEEGFNWLIRLNAWGAGACLADDMGLGKTLQAIAAMLHLAPNGPSMVVCPASVINNWCNEIVKFAPTLNPIVLKPGSTRKETFAALSSFDVLVVSYGLLQSEEENINAIDWSMAVLDEAHAIKNTNTKSSKAAMGIKAGFRLALTGTPVQNHLGELWNLFQFCNPGLLGSLQHFTDRYVKSELPEQKVHLKKLISPFILRRTKNKVLSELPPKTEITHSVELSKEELAFYEALRRQAISLIESGGGNAGQQHLQALAEITRLRLACCNPSLVNADIELPSSKLAAFIEIMEELRANSHRALVFSQFIGHLAIVRQSLDQMGVSYQYLDGSTSLPDREKAVKAFQAGKGELFLISLKAGGLGLNLTAADYVIHLDPWWNPAIEDQASDRAHRIGQTRPVTIYRLVAKNTIEEKILQLHATKRDMADSLLEGSDQNSRLSTKELLELIREG